MTKDASRVAIAAASCCARCVFLEIFYGRGLFARRIQRISILLRREGKDFIEWHRHHDPVVHVLRDEGFLATARLHQVSRICRKFPGQISTRLLEGENSISWSTRDTETSWELFFIGLRWARKVVENKGHVFLRKKKNYLLWNW